MNAAIADILKAKLNNLPWLDRFGGMVNMATRPNLVTVDGAQVVAGYQVYPVACDVNDVNCWETGLFKHFEPDSTKTAIAFFVDDGGVTLKGVEGPKQTYLKFSFSLKFLCWLNLKRLGEDLTVGSCNLSGRLAPYVMAQLWGCHSAFGKFDGGIEEEQYQAVEVTGINQLQKSQAMFSPFTFATDGEKRGLFLYPYDYFGLRITGTFVINVKCLNEVFFSPEEICLTQ